MLVVVVGPGTAGDATSGSGSNVSNALRYIKDRVSVPRDMPLWSAMRFRDACEQAAQAYDGTVAAVAEDSAGGRKGSRSKPISTRHRRDQNPAPFAAALVQRRRANDKAPPRTATVAAAGAL